jgi:hypothetical protein
LFRRLLGLPRRRSSLPLPPPALEPEPDVVEPAQPERSEAEHWLLRLASDLAEGKRKDDLVGDEFWKRVDELLAAGRFRVASQLLEKFVAAEGLADDVVTRIRLRLVALHEERGNLEPALGHLEHLTREEPHALSAHERLAEHYRLRGQEVLALRHYEAILARDVNHPNIRARVERLRKQRGRGKPAAMGETMAGLIGVSAGGARYALLRELGRGATGAVYLARDQDLHRDVAVKLLHPHVSAQGRAAACARFFAEARIAASLRHPNILAILDVDEKARRIVMELAAGGTLRDVLRQGGPRPLARALEHHVEILSALGAAHRRGIVHRDVKPANLMFRKSADAEDVEIVLGDFGVAHLPDAKGEDHLVGTPAYMAPGQRRNEAANARWDVFAAAVVLYEMLAGTLPWSRERALAGTRTMEDFRLPAAAKAGIAADMIEAVQRHIFAIGEPDVTKRLSSEEAHAEALVLVERALALS